MTWSRKTAIIDAQQDQALGASYAIVCEYEGQRCYCGLKVRVMHGVGLQFATAWAFVHHETNRGHQECETGLGRRNQGT